MDYSKYSNELFEAAGLDSAAARKLADQLAADVAQEVHVVVLPKLQELVAGLRSVGHQLQPYEDIRIGDVSYRDEPSPGMCRLRLACDTVISTGYAHTVEPE